MRWLMCAAALAAAVALSGCSVLAIGPVPGALTIDQKGPVAVGDPNVSPAKVGRAEAQGILLVSWGDASISQAAKNGNITRIHHVDSETLNVFGIYAKYETFVYGE